jgi:aspartyl-tRNA(Asn)/glutamyl-tRNA(Gln) amidotransferase subunit A
MIDADKILEEAKEIDSEYCYFNVISDDLAREPRAEGLLKDISISLKDCICVKGVETKASSRILTGYNPVFDATVTKKIKQQGGIIIGKTAQDVFGFGSFATNVGLDMVPPLNPFDKARCTGGSSGGAAGFTQKTKFRHIAIAESTGGSIVCPASFCGVYGLCPTYGLVSRYGLLDYANSMDKIGVMAKKIDDVAIGLKVIAGYDPKDSTSYESSPEDYSEYSVRKSSDFRIAVFNKSFDKGVDKAVSEQVVGAIDTSDSNPKMIDLPLNKKYSVLTYYLLAMCEASTNLAKYCGMRYGKHEKLVGNFNDYFSNVRSLHFNAEAKRRIIIGTFARMSGFRDAYYIKAAKVRTKLIEEYKKTFSEFDLIVSPTMPIVAPNFNEIKKLTPLQHYLMDMFLSGPNLAGLPHINIPVGFKEGLPVGMTVVADHFNEMKLIEFAKAIEK